MISCLGWRIFTISFWWISQMEIYSSKLGCNPWHIWRILGQLRRNEEATWMIPTGQDAAQLNVERRGVGGWSVWLMWLAGSWWSNHVCSGSAAEAAHSWAVTGGVVYAGGFTACGLHHANAREEAAAYGSVASVVGDGGLSWLLVTGGWWWLMARLWWSVMKAGPFF